MTRILPLIVTLMLGCNASSPEEEAREGDIPPPRTFAEASKATPQAAPSERAVMPNAQKTFNEIVELLGEHYVDGPLSEDEIWSAAAEGVMSRLIQLDDVRINKIMSPGELRELQRGTRGNLIGIGVVIEKVTGAVVVRETISGSPADRAGIRPGDRILGVGGERIHELEIPDIVQRIRGEEGTTVEVFVQRDIEEWTVEITRAPIAITSVESRELEDGIGYVRINLLAETTPDDLDDALRSLQQEGSRGVVLDLRDCPGGLLDMTVEVASRFLPAGQTVVSLRGRESERVMETTGDHGEQTFPLVVLIDRSTASGAEIIAGALRDHERATIVGDTSAGKGTVESVHELENGWGLKLTAHRFYLPSGESPHGRGVAPHIVVPAEEGRRKVPIAEVGTMDDAQLSAAIQLLIAR